MSSSNYSLHSLAAELAELTATLEATFIKNGLPMPSMEVDGPTDYPTMGVDSKEFTKTRYDIVDKARKLASLALGPRESINHLAFSFHDYFCLAVIRRYSLAKTVPLDAPIQYSDIAEAVSLSEHQVRSVMRHAITNGIFYEPTAGHVAHNGVSKLLLEPTTNALFGHFVDEVWTVQPNVLEAWDRFPSLSEPTETAFALSIGKGKNIFEYFTTHEEARTRFSLAMSALIDGGGFSSRFLRNGYAWEKLPEGATVVDVGGADGAIAVTLANEFPHLKFVVQDLAGVVAPAEDTLPASLLDRITFQAHDFFAPQPVHADVYFLRQILHDWPDKYCTIILRHLIAAMRPSSKIIICDAVMVEPTETSVEQFWMKSAMNLQMLTALNSKERSLHDWNTLFSQTDSRLVLNSIVTPEGSQHSILEVILSE